MRVTGSRQPETPRPRRRKVPLAFLLCCLMLTGGCREIIRNDFLDIKKDRQQRKAIVYQQLRLQQMQKAMQKIGFSCGKIAVTPMQGYFDGTNGWLRVECDGYPYRAEVLNYGDVPSALRVLKVMP